MTLAQISSRMQKLDHASGSKPSRSPPLHAPLACNSFPGGAYKRGSTSHTAVGIIRMRKGQQFQFSLRFSDQSHLASTRHDIKSHLNNTWRRRRGVQRGGCLVAGSQSLRPCLVLAARECRTTSLLNIYIYMYSMLLSASAAACCAGTGSQRCLRVR